MTIKTRVNSILRLTSDDEVVSQVEFKVERPDEWFDKEYVSVFDLLTILEYRRKRFAKMMLNYLFDYVRDELKLDTITLVVYKTNKIALSLYFGVGFEIFREYGSSYSLVKHL